MLFVRYNVLLCTISLSHLVVGCRIRQRAVSGSGPDQAADRARHPMIRHRAGSGSGPDQAVGRIRQRAGSGSGPDQIAAGPLPDTKPAGRIMAGTAPDQAAGRIRVYNRA